ncbi:MAG: SulP family inorganic anion transporter [Verrucomicrobia bacterium]|nr:MAG: SulP family inorganic anion transporter [Verrucomicrobiota bacterium]TAE88909.1 MAG: SulP family inorganic anion transporter [Verrucomicrobiota bacterium]TAF27326.1 MAG: SulP family inorganic anion transporter [Verrucomicrobiota bacterium]TAF42383.1 MAG: SulP family inorganic anion transporter [Verrucomicrobiota bacterium]
MIPHFQPRRIFRRIGRFFESGRLDPLPLRHTLRRYSREKFKADGRAALNVALLDIPQGIAYAAIAELPIVFGIACSATASIIAPLFAGSRHTILGPTNATAFMLFGFFAMEPGLAARETQLVPLLVMMVGLFCLVGAILRVADLLQYISRSVLVGYVSGAAVLIITNQFKHLLGVAAEVDALRPSTFVGLVEALVRSIPAASWQPLLIGTIAFTTFHFLRKWKPRWPNLAIVLVFVSAIFGTLAFQEQGPFSQIARFSPFTPQDLLPSLPPLARAGIFDDISALFGVALAIAFLACLENTLMAKTIASRSGDRSDVNQDMFAVGAANFASSIAGGMPASGSLLRSSLNFSSGARTRMSSIFSGTLVLSTALLIAWLPKIGIDPISHVPKAALAALVIGIALALINRHNLRVCLRSTPDDAAVLVTTFVATLIAPLDVAIFIGVALSITLFLRKASRPHLVEYEFSDAGELRQIGERRQRPNPAISIVHVEGDLFFGAAELFRTQIQRTAADPSLRILILRLKNARHLDATSVLALEDLIKFMRANQRHVLISGATRDVYRVLKHSGVLATIQQGSDRQSGESNLFLNRPSNPNISTRDALKRAQQLLGGEKAEVRIFYDPSQK